MRGVLHWFWALLLAAWIDTSSALEGCEHGVDMAFVVDTSRSLTKENFELQMEFVLEMASMFKVGPDDTQISVLQYAHRMYQLFCFDDFLTNYEVMKAIQRKHRYFRGSTKTSKAFKRLRKRIFNTKKCGMREPSIRVAILLTDGMPDYPDAAIKEARLLREHGVILVTIGIGDEIARPMLEEFATHPTLAFNTTDFFELDLIRPHVAMEACKEINPELDMPACHVGADILFIIDHSRSLANVDHALAMDFVEHFARNFIVSDEDFHTRVAVMHYSHKVYDHFCFHEFMTNVELSLKINHTEIFPEGSSNIHRALNFARNRMFKPSCGARDSAFKIVVLMTDAKANFPQLALKEADALKQQGVKLVTVGLGDIDPHVLHPLSSHHHLVFDNVHVVNIEKITAHVSSGACALARNTNHTWSHDELKVINAHANSDMHKDFDHHTLQKTKYVLTDGEDSHFFHFEDHDH